MPWQDDDGHFADLLIKELRTEPLGMISEEDAKKEGYESRYEFKQAWKDIHGDWLTDHVVWVIEFETVKTY